MALEPITREEQIMSGESLEPITREEMFLAKAGGQDVYTPTPITRKEMFLQKIAENGGGSGGSGGLGNIDSLIDGSATELTSNAASVSDYALYYNKKIVSVRFPQAVSVGMSVFTQCSSLKSVDLPKAETAGSGAFSGCTALESVNVPMLKTAGGNLFNGCTELKKMVFPSLETMGDKQFLYRCVELEIVDFSCVQQITEQCFYNNNSLKAVVLRRNTLTTLQMSFSNIFANCYHFLGTTNSTYNPNGLKDGYIYVPRSLVEEYKVATNWTAAADRFRALEDYTVDGTTTGALDASKI